MRNLCAVAAVLAVANSAFAAPNVTNVTQKGSLLIWPDIRASATEQTLIRIQNDGGSDVDVICYWMDGNKNKVDFIIPLTRNQAVWFDAATGNGGNFHVNAFPTGPANGFPGPTFNPFLPTAAAAYRAGLLACWAVDGGAQNQVKWNHLSGTATIYSPANGYAYEYSAYAFFIPTGIDLAPIGVAGALNLNGVEYDACPLYQIGQFTPADVPVANQPVNAPAILANRLALVACNLNLNQDWVPVWTKYQFDVWNQDEVKFTGAFECADSWHETQFGDGALTLIGGTLSASRGGIDSAAQNFSFATLGTYAARYRVQGTKSTQCEKVVTTTGIYLPAIVTQAVGVIAVQASFLLPPLGNLDAVGSTLAAAGRLTGRIVWDPESAVPEGGIR